MRQSPKVLILKNANGMEVKISNYGATVLNVIVPDRDNIPVNVVVGFAQPEDYYAENYLKDSNYLGATVGRWAGRISGGKFTMDDEVYELYNENGVHLHGGKEGFDKKYWNIESVSSSSVVL